MQAVVEIYETILFLMRSVLDLWGAKWQCDKFHQIIVTFTYKVIYHQCSVFIHLSSGRWTLGQSEAGLPLRPNFTQTQNQQVRQNTHNVTFRRVLRNYCCRGKALSITHYYVCVCVCARVCVVKSVAVT